MDTRDTGASQSSFDDFVLEVLDDRDDAGERRVSKDRVYSVRLRTPAGDPQALMRLPFDQEELDNLLLKVENAILWSGGLSHRVIPSERLRVVQEFGATMFQAALGDGVSGLYYQSRAMAEQRGRGLRLKLRIEPPELAALPWEFLFDRQRSSFVGLSTRTPIVRDLGLPFAAEPLAVDGPLRILGMMASPRGLDQIDIPREKARVDKALAESIGAGSIDLRWLPGKTWEDLKDEIEHGQFHVFHFIGHGGFDAAADQGLIALANEDDEPYYLPADDLAMLLEGEDALRLVMLNSCDGARGGTHDIFSSTAAILVRRANCAVVAMQYEITDAAAIAFSRSFYRALAGGMPIDAAVASGRQAIRLSTPGSLEWATPVLYQRAPDGVLFALKPGIRPALPPSQPADGGDDRSKPPEDEPPRKGPGPGGQNVLAVVRGEVDSLIEPAATRAVLLLALGIALLAGLLFDPTPWAIVAGAIGVLVSIGLTVAARVADGECVNRRERVFQRALRTAAFACAGVGVIAMLLVADGVPGLSRTAADINDWTLPQRSGALLAGIGAIALGARFAGARWPRWANGRIGAGGVAAIFLTALVAFLPFDTPSPQPVVAAACDVQRAVPATAGEVDVSRSTMFRGTASRTGDGSKAHDESPEVRTLASSDDQVWSSAAIADGKMFVGSNDGMVHGVDVTTGKPLEGWPFDTRGIVYSSPLVADGVVYVGSFTSVDGALGELHAIEIATGAERRGWPLQVQAGIFASPVMVNESVVVGDIEGHLYEVDLASGEARETDLDSPVWSTAAVVDGVAYVGTQDRGVVAVGLADGDIRWSFRAGPVTSSPAVVHGTVYVGSDDGCVYAIDALSGAELWRFQTGDKVFSSPAVSNETVYVGSKDSVLYALDADTGQEIWRFDTKAKIWSSPAISDGVVYFGCDDGNLYALDSVTGTESWHVSLVQRMLTLPDYHGLRQMRASPLVAGDYVVMGSYDGSVYVVTVGDLAAPLPLATPMPITPEALATPVT